MAPSDALQSTLGVPSVKQPLTDSLLTGDTMSKSVNVAIIGLGFGTQFVPIYKRHKKANVHAETRRCLERVNREAKFPRRSSSSNDAVDF